MRNLRLVAVAAGSTLLAATALAHADTPGQFVLEGGGGEVWVDAPPVSSSGITIFEDGGATRKLDANLSGSSWKLAAGYVFDWGRPVRVMLVGGISDLDGDAARSQMFVGGTQAFYAKTLDTSFNNGVAAGNADMNVQDSSRASLSENKIGIELSTPVELGPRTSLRVAAAILYVESKFKSRFDTFAEIVAPAYSGNSELHATIDAHGFRSQIEAEVTQQLIDRLSGRIGAFVGVAPVHASLAAAQSVDYTFGLHHLDSSFAASKSQDQVIAGVRAGLDYALSARTTLSVEGFADSNDSAPTFRPGNRDVGEFSALEFGNQTSTGAILILSTGF
ncbi:MAG: hypothetical protein GC190_21345 [Alphaproteobacteria bacterium]|nr:hypothetical protein [Alphaproteobacteria bacterium]